jgi:small subunit ribosomal protein S9
MNKSVTSNSSQIFHGVGRRKSSVARVWLKPGKGSIVINGVEHNQYFDTDITKEMVELPFRIAGIAFNVEVNVNGGGLVGQAGAIKLGIARALVVSDENLKPVLKKHKLLTCDSRVKERKKYGQKAARRKFQFVKR